MPHLIADNLAKQYPTRNEPLVVLRGVSLTLATGDNVAVLGPSGCGKSTLLHILGTLDRPTAGQLRLDGCDLLALDEPQLADFRSGQIGFVFQDHHLLPQCTALENVLLPAMANGAVPAKAIERGRMLLERVGLNRRLDHLPAELSGGERQRVALARALVNQPTLLLADEPTGNLDRTTAASVARLLIEMQEQEQTMLIVVTHSMELARLLRRRMELDDGRLKEVAQ